MPRRMMQDGGEANVQRKHRLEAQTWKVGDAVRLNWPGISHRLRCRVIAIRWWCRGMSCELECPVIRFPKPQTINHRQTLTLCVTADCIEPWRDP